MQISKYLTRTFIPFIVFSSYQKSYAETFQTYFNHSNSSQFVEPYRQIQRPGHNFEEILIRSIDSAQKRIWIAVQEFRLPNVYNALLKKFKTGVEVRLILENQYSAPFPYRNKKDLSLVDEYSRFRFEDYFYFLDQNADEVLSDQELLERDVLTQIKKDGIPMIDDTSDGSRGSGLMHHKFILIDDELVVSSSANFTWSDFFGDFLRPFSRGNPNSLMLIQNKDAAIIFEEEFLQMWKLKKFGLKKSPRGPQKIAFEDGRALWVQFAPTSPSPNRVPWEKSALGTANSILSQAKKSIELSLFVFSEQRISNTLESRVSKGIQLSALIDSEFAYRDYSEVLDIFGLQMLNRFCKIELNNHPWVRPLTIGVGSPRLPGGDKYHHKFATVDNEWTMVGSLNWSAAGNHNNDETILFIKDPALTSKFREEHARALGRSWTGIPFWLPQKISDQEKSCLENPTPRPTPEPNPDPED